MPVASESCRSVSGVMLTSLVVWLLSTAECNEPVGPTTRTTHGSTASEGMVMRYCAMSLVVPLIWVVPLAPMHLKMTRALVIPAPVAAVPAKVIIAGCCCGTVKVATAPEPAPPPPPPPQAAKRDAAAKTVRRRNWLLLLMDKKACVVLGCVM